MVTAGMLSISVQRISQLTNSIHEVEESMDANSVRPKRINLAGGEPANAASLAASGTDSGVIATPTHKEVTNEEVV